MFHNNIFQLLRFLIVILFGFLILTCLISNKQVGEISLMDLLLDWFTKFVTSFSLERSQEDILKFMLEESVSV